MRNTLILFYNCVYRSYDASVEWLLLGLALGHGAVRHACRPTPMPYVKCGARHGICARCKLVRTMCIWGYRQKSTLSLVVIIINSIVRLTAVPGTRLLRYRRKVELFRCTRSRVYQGNPSVQAGRWHAKKDKKNPSRRSQFAVAVNPTRTLSLHTAQLIATSILRAATQSTPPRN